MIADTCQKNAKGMSLIEVVLSFAIISMLIMSFYSIFSSSIHQTAGEQFDDQAVQLSRTILDGVRAHVFKDQTMMLYEQNLDLEPFRDPNQKSAFDTQPLFYPEREHPLFRIMMHVERLPGTVQLNLDPSKKMRDKNKLENQPLSKQTVQLSLGDYFRKITLTLVDTNGVEHRFESIITVR